MIRHPKRKKDIIADIHALRRKVGWDAFADYWNEQRMMRFSKSELLAILEKEKQLSLIKEDK